MPTPQPLPRPREENQSRRCRRDLCPEPLPIRWPEELPRPEDEFGLVRTPGDVRAEEALEGRGSVHRKFAEEIEEARLGRLLMPPPQPCDPAVEHDDSRWNTLYDAHHIHPLFLSGAAEARSNLCALEHNLHERGHPRLYDQSDLLDIYMQCGICSGNLRQHPAYQAYYIWGTK